MTLPPYPPDRYPGVTGEATARLRRTDAAPEIDRPDVAVRYLATGASTDGQLGLYRWEMGPRRGGPDPHFHRSITESFYVLAGGVELYDGGQWLAAGPGDFLYVPQGGVHGFRNTSGEPATMLILFTPGAPREDYFERVHTVRDMDEDERTQFFAHHDTWWV
jgi:mannose-6-phosphate isomerase-like protein (cupin superfamily)